MPKLQPISQVIDSRLARETEKDVHGLFINGEYFGLLTEPFAPDFSAEWDDDGYADIVSGLAGAATEVVAGVSPKAGAVIDAVKKANPQQLGKLAGIHVGEGIGLMAKKMFSKAGYWSWSANVRLVDWDGEGLVFQRVEMLKKLALPSITSAAGAISDVAASGAGAINELITGQAREQQGGIIDAEAIAGAMARSVVLAPQPMHIRVGRYANTMGAGASDSMKVVISAFTTSLSMEYIENVGPMWADFSITFDSVEPMVAEAMPIGKSRVTISEEG